MTMWQVEATIMPKDGVNDPQGEAVLGGLRSLEFDGVRNVRVGKIIAISIEARTEEDAIELATQMCDRLLANPVIEMYAVTATPTIATSKESAG